MSLLEAIVGGLIIIIIIGVLIYIFGGPENLKQYITLLQELGTIMSIAAMVGNLLA
ncbi:hypothetical protein [Saccharolobus islandicus]|uniref:Uncharacterized protein n=2 Tax=Saccharolobus islandicus TaxID=43080 RepID=M9U8A4_SACIS|nr:hypothetical protein [Sulfolobus islandicus]ADX84914.1 hypothetical protein SiRe_0839 [Sulfolobus islandicus REY15A]AGJ62323.1 Hypothetical Protein SiL_0869 [Sulfolobus islandicus LAL14/1]